MSDPDDLGPVERADGMSPNAKGFPGIVGFSIRNWRMTIGIMLFAIFGGFFADRRAHV